jgi:YVTN family beta-propeller protein
MWPVPQERVALVIFLAALAATLSSMLMAIPVIQDATGHEFVGGGSYSSPVPRPAVDAAEMPGSLDTSTSGPPIWETGTVTATVAIGSRPSAVAYDGGNGDLYVANAGDAFVYVISGATNQLVGAPIPVGYFPYAIAYDSGNGDLYVVNLGANSLSVINGATNQVVGAPIPVESDPDAVAYDSANGDLYVTNDLTNNVSVISGATNRVVGTPIPVGIEPFGVAYDSENGDLYVVNGGTASVDVINGASNQVVGAPIPIQSTSEGVAYDSGNGDLYVTDSGTNNVSVISGATNQVVGSPIAVGIEPYAAAYDGGNGDLYVTNADGNSVSVISGATDQVVGTSLAIGSDPIAIAYDSGNGDLYVVNDLTYNVSVISTLLMLGGASPSSSASDVSQSLVVNAPIVGEGTGTNLTMTIYSSNNSGLSCSAAPLSLYAVSGTCIAHVAGNYSVILTLTDSDANSVWSSLTTNVFSDPTVSTPTATPASVDAGQITVLTTSASGGSGGYTYSWSGLPMGCVTENGAGLACTPSLAGSSSVSVSVVDSDGFLVTSSVTTVDVSPTLSMATVVASLATVSVGQTIDFTVSVSGGSGTYTYAWTAPSDCITTATAIITCTPTSASDAPLAVLAKVTDSNGASVTAVSPAVSVTSQTVTPSNLTPSWLVWTATGLSVAAIVTGAAAIVSKGRKDGGSGRGFPPPKA